MAKKAEVAEKLITIQAAVPVVVWKVNRPLTEEQHAELARKLRAEQQNTGVELILVPHSVDLYIASKIEEQTVEALPAMISGQSEDPLQAPMNEQVQEGGASE